MTMPDYPGAIVVPAHPTNILRPINRPKVLVLHTPEEPADNVESTPRYFQTPNLGASTHYYADNDGDLYQMVPEGNGAIANGVIGKTYPEGTNAGHSLNYQSLSIEIEGYAASIGRTMPRGGSQWRTVVAWVVTRAKKYNIPIRRSRIIGHYEVANNRTDPGTLDIDAIVADAQAAVEEEPDMPQPTVAEILRVLALLNEAAEAARFEVPMKPATKAALHYLLHL
jgi:N-acetyl-anhydromuramyl-L-alanine amidase AmpD